MLPEYFAYITIVIGLVGIFLYIKETIKGKTRPNLVTWIFWAIAPLVGVYISYKSGVSFLLLLSTFMSGFGPLLVVVFSIFHKNSYWKISSFDIICGIFAFIAIIIFITTKNSILSLVFAIVADLFAGIPTIVKAYNHNETEPAWPYTLGLINAIIILLIIKDFNFTNYSFPVYLILLDLTLILCIKQKEIRKFLHPLWSLDTK